MPDSPEFADVEAAAARIAPYAVETPVLESADLNQRLGGRVLFKAETLQRTGSFKFRGACNRCLLIPEAERPRGVVAFSSGNHGQAVAAVAALLGMKATIVMPSDAPKAKIEGTRARGAAIVLYDRRTEDREAIAAAIQQQSGATLVRPFDDPGVVAGQGTAALELARTANAHGVVIDQVLVPCSGGGLSSGTALALATAHPSARVIAVEPEDYDGMGRSLAAGARMAAPARALSMADALMSPIPGTIPFAVAETFGVRGVAVNDEAFARAVSYAVRNLKLVVEPSGAAGLAAILCGAIDARKKTTAIVLSGGNCDPDTLHECCARVPAP